MYKKCTTRNSPTPRSRALLKVHQIGPADDFFSKGDQVFTFGTYEPLDFQKKTHG